MKTLEELRELCWYMLGVSEGGVFEKVVDGEDDVQPISEHDKWQE